MVKKVRFSIAMQTTIYLREENIVGSKEINSREFQGQQRKKYGTVLMRYAAVKNVESTDVCSVVISGIAWVLGE